MSGRFAKNNAGKIVGSLKNFYLPDVSLLALAASSNAASGKDYSKDLIAFFQTNTDHHRGEMLPRARIHLSGDGSVPHWVVSFYKSG